MRRGRRRQTGRRGRRPHGAPRRRRPGTAPRPRARRLRAHGGNRVAVAGTEPRRRRAHRVPRAPGERGQRGGQAQGGPERPPAALGRAAEGRAARRRVRLRLGHGARPRRGRRRWQRPLSGRRRGGGLPRRGMGSALAGPAGRATRPGGGEGLARLRPRRTPRRVGAAPGDWCQPPERGHEHPAALPLVRRLCGRRPCGPPRECGTEGSAGCGGAGVSGSSGSGRRGCGRPGRYPSRGAPRIPGTAGTARAPRPRDAPHLRSVRGIVKDKSLANVWHPSCQVTIPTYPQWMMIHFPGLAGPEWLGRANRCHEPGCSRRTPPVVVPGSVMQRECVAVSVQTVVRRPQTRNAHARQERPDHHPRHCRPAQTPDSASKSTPR